MTRKFLEDKGLSKELIDEILDENSKDIGKAKGELESVKSQLETAQKDNEGLKEQISKANTDLETLKNSNDNNSAVQKCYWKNGKYITENIICTEFKNVEELYEK